MKFLDNRKKLKERVTKRCKCCGCITFSNSDVCNECF